MNIKRLVFWTSVFCCLMFYILLFERPVEKEKITAKQEINWIFPDGHNTAKQIEIIYESTNIKLKKSNGTWETGNSAAGFIKVRPEIIDSLVDAVMEAVVIEVIDKNPGSMDQYGLLNPAMKIRVFNDKEPNPVVLSVGSKSPIGISVYARLNTSPQIFLTGNYLIFSIKTFAKNMKQETR